jgi:CcmD family protein
MADQNLIYLFTAYAIIWIVLFGYMWYQSQQVHDLRQQVDALRHRQSTAPPEGDTR